MNIHLKGALLLGAVLVGNSMAADAPVPSPKPVTRIPQRASSNSKDQVSDQTRTEIRTITEKYRPQITALFQKRRDAQKELQEAVRAENPDEKLIREKAAAIGKIEGDLAVLQAKQYHELKPLLPARSIPASRTNALQKRIPSARLANPIPSSAAPK
jgi:Spy/CpxP family protein refolding chaperone